MTFGYQAPMYMDLMRSDTISSMNLGMNQMMDNLRVQQGWWNNSIYNYNFSAYPGISSYSCLTNPFYTMGQMNWNCGFNNMMGFYPSLNYYPSSSSNSSNSSTQNKQYNRLYSLLKQMALAEDIFSGSEIDMINEAVKNTKGNADEKYERLLEAYNQLNKDDIRLFLVECGGKLGVSSDLKGKEGEDSFLERLLETGHQYDDTVIDDYLESFHGGIEDLDETDAQSEDVNKVIGLIEVGEVDILDFVSSWNTYFKDDSDSSRVINYIADKYNSISDKDARATFKSKVIKPLVEEMIKKAKSVSRSLDKTSKDNMSTIIEDLRDALSGTSTRVDSNLASAFDKLYLFTRQAAVAELANDAKGYYGEIDDVVFNESLFEQDMIDDLEEEGFSGADIEATKVAISERKVRRRNSERTNDNRDKDDDRESNINSNPFKGIDKKTAIEQINILVANDILEKLTIKSNGRTVWREATMTGDSDGDGVADYAKLYCINKDAKLVELTNTKTDNGSLIKIKSDVEQTEKLRNGSEIANTYKKVSSKDDSDSDNSNFNAKEAGENVAEQLNFVFTGRPREARIEDNIKGVNKDNIIAFLDGAYGKLRETNNRGLLEKLYEKGNVSQDTLVNWITYVIDIAEDMPSVKNSEELKNLKNTKEYYDKQTGSNKFNARSRYSQWHKAIFGRDDLEEVFDEELKKLFDKIKQVQASA